VHRERRRDHGRRHAGPLRAERLRAADRAQPARLDPLLSRAARLFAEKCVDGIEANRETCERYAELTLSAATALNPYIGYDKATEIVKEAAVFRPLAARGRPDAGVDEETLDTALDYRRDGRSRTKAAEADS
jgi:fumarate hydratase class II